MIVANNHQNAAVDSAAGKVSVADGINAAVQPRPLAVPHGKDPVAGGIAESANLLRAPNRSRRQILVDRGPELDAGPRQQSVGGPQLLVQIVHGRAAIAGNEAFRA